MTGQAAHLRILCVTHDTDLAIIIRLALQLDPRISVEWVADEQAALELMAGGYRPDAVLLDTLRSSEAPSRTASSIRDLLPDAAVPIIFLTHHPVQRRRDELLEEGATAVILKPFDPLRLAGYVRGQVPA